MADIDQQREQIVARAFRARIKIGALCKLAGVAPSTWSRWNAEAVAPKQETIDKLTAALDELERRAA